MPLPFTLYEFIVCANPFFSIPLAEVNPVLRHWDVHVWSSLMMDRGSLHLFKQKQSQINFAESSRWPQ